MKMAIEEARRSQQEGGIPIGSVLTRDGEVIGKGHNRRIQEGNPILHAEIHCLQNAGRIVDYSNTTLYSTLMPCYLCSGAVIQFGIPRIIVGEADTFAGDLSFLRSKDVNIIVLDSIECKTMLQKFIEGHLSLWLEDIGEHHRATEGWAQGARRSRFRT